jgi:hypothetical protein
VTPAEKEVIASIEQRVEWDMQNEFNVVLKGRKIYQGAGKNSRPASRLELRLWSAIRDMKIKEMTPNVVVPHEHEEAKD